MDQKFDVESARKSGYSDDEIVDYLAKTRNFDVDAAIKSGYSKSEILSHLNTSSSLPGSEVGFFGGVKEMLIPGWEETKNLVKIIAAGGLTPGHPMSTELGKKMLIEPAIGQIERAQNRFSKGEYAAGIGQGALAALPLIGPAIGTAAERITHGEPARGIGNVVGMALPGAASATIKATLPTKTLPNPNEIPMTWAQRKNTASARKFEAVIEHTLPAANMFEKARAKQQAYLIDTVAGNVLKDISNPVMKASASGKDFIASIKSKLDDLENSASMKYQQLDDELGTKYVTVKKDVPATRTTKGTYGEPVTEEYMKPTYTKEATSEVMPETKTLKQFAIDVYRKLEQQSKLINPEELSGVMGQLKTIIKSPKTMPFMAMKGARSTLLSIVRKYKEYIPPQKGGLEKHFVNLTTESMEEALKKAGRKDLMSVLNAADDEWRTLKQVGNQSVIGKIVEMAPEDVASYLGKLSLDEIKLLRNYSSTPAWQSLKASFLNDMLTKSIQGESTTWIPESLQKITNPLLRTHPTLKGSGESGLLGKIEGLGKEYFEEIYNPRERAQIQGIAMLADRMQVPSSSWISSALNSVIIAGAGMGLYGVGGTASKAAYLTAGLNAIGRLMVAPSGAGSRAIRNLVYSIGKNNVPEITFWSNRIAELATQDEER